MNPWSRRTSGNQADSPSSTCGRRNLQFSDAGTSNAEEEKFAEPLEKSKPDQQLAAARAGGTMNRLMFEFCFCLAGLFGPAHASGEDQPAPLCSIRLGEKDSARRRRSVDGVRPRREAPRDPHVDADQERYLRLGCRSIRLDHGETRRFGDDCGGGRPVDRAPARCIISPTGEWLAYCGKDSRMQFLVIPPHKPELPGKIDLRFHVVRDRLWIDAAGTGLYAMFGLDDKYAMHWMKFTDRNAPGAKQVRVVFRAGERNTDIRAVTLDPIAGRFAAAIEPYEDGKRSIECWTLTQKPISVTIQTKIRADSLAFSPDGELLVAGFGNGSVAWYDTATGRSIIQVATPGGFTVGSLAVHPTGKQLACGTFQRGAPNLFLIDLSSGEFVAKLLADANGVTNVCFSPNGDKLAAFGSSGTVTIWKATKLLKLERDGFGCSWSASHPPKPRTTKKRRREGVVGQRKWAKNGVIVSFPECGIRHNDLSSMANK